MGNKLLKAKSCDALTAVLTIIRTQTPPLMACQSSWKPGKGRGDVVCILYSICFSWKVSVECTFPANVRICFVSVWPHSDTLTWLSCITLNSAGLHTFAAFTAERCVGCVVNLCKCPLISSRWERPLSSWCLPGCYCYGKTSPSSPNHSRHPLHCSAASLVNIRKCFSGCVCWWFSVYISVRVVTGSVEWSL